MYKLTNNEFGEPTMILKVNENLYIPIFDGNRHYQEYLEWVADGGVVEPADE